MGLDGWTLIGSGQETSVVLVDGLEVDRAKKGQIFDRGARSGENLSIQLRSRSLPDGGLGLLLFGRKESPSIEVLDRVILGEVFDISLYRYLLIRVDIRLDISLIETDIEPDIGLTSSISISAIKHPSIGKILSFMISHQKKNFIHR